MFKKIKQLKDNEKLMKLYNYLTDISTFRKTFKLALIYVFLFYLPYTILTLVFNRIVFFQLDHLYQFSTIVMDFRNRVFDLNFSTWDFKNIFGYDYFANFYYISLDFSLIPFFLFPFIAFHKQMWLSFLLKILVGTGAFTYLLKLYKLSNKTILITSVIYGTSDLFFAQNVFPTYTGLIVYIPLVLIAIEFIFQKKNYFFFSLVIFQIFLFNFYWSWALSLFMALSLLLRYIYEHLTIRNFYKPLIILKAIWFFTKSILFYLIGFGLAAFFLFPIFNIILNEPRMASNEFDLSTFFSFDKNVYFKTFFKMLVPNLYSYDGFFYDKSLSYFLPTNHIIIYSSIFVSFSLFSFIFQPIILIKKQLTKVQIKTVTFLKISTFLLLFLMMFPVVAMVFSGTTTPYLRYFIFFGVLLIIDFAFLIEYKLFNKKLFIAFLVTSSLYLGFSLIYNNLKDTVQGVFHLADLGVTITLLVAYVLFTVLLIVFYRKSKTLYTILLIEKIISFVLIFAVCVFFTDFSIGVRENSAYGKAMNQLSKGVVDEYGVTYDLINSEAFDSFDSMQNMLYLNKYPIYNNFNTFHSLINPYFKLFPEYSGHERSYKAFDFSYFYYLYTDPRYFYITTANETPYGSNLYPPDSQLVDEKYFKNFDSTIALYELQPNFSIGTGFTTYNSKKLGYYNYLWLDSLYVSDEDQIKALNELGFTESSTNAFDYIEKINNVTSNDYIFDYNFSDDYNIEEDYKFTEFDLNVTKAQSDVVIIDYYYSKSIEAAYLVDNEENVNRCFNHFCYVPKSGIDKIIIGYKPGFVNVRSVSLYTVDAEMLKEQIKEVQKYSTKNLEMDGNTIKTNVYNDKPIIMNYKIGYAPGWTAYVDGIETEIFPGHSGLISFALTETKDHEIILQYKTPWLKEGLILSGISLLIFTSLLTTYILINRHKRKLNNELNEKK
ncbi:MAG: multidrug resistance protein [Haloplasmataceae bacterium]|nr:multidrug resistance protein [Haloplasmataceae bacterium]